MLIYTRTEKSKPKLKPRKEREQYDAWLKKHQVNKPVNQTKPASSYQLKLPPGRSTTRHIPSIDSGFAVASAPVRKVYTGDKIIGIGTLHKSNAVPIFSEEEAKDIAKMRR